MSEQERYDALIADLAALVHDGHPVAGWSQGHKRGRVTEHKVMVVYADGAPATTFTFNALSITPRTA